MSPSSGRSWCTAVGLGIASASGGPKASLTSVAGYAILGGVFFLISAVRLHRLTSKAN